jgi:hypothetical protein
VRSFCGLPNDDTSSLHHDWVLKMEEVNDWCAAKRHLLCALTSS